MAQQYPPGPPQPWSTPDQTGFGQPDAYVQPHFDAQPTVEPTGIAGPDRRRPRADRLAAAAPQVSAPGRTVQPTGR